MSLIKKLEEEKERLEKEVNELRNQLEIADDCAAVSIAEEIFSNIVVHADEEYLPTDYTKIAKRALNAGHAFVKQRSRYYKRMIRCRGREQ